MSAKRSQLNVDQQRWEDGLLLHSGVATVTAAHADFDDEEDTRVQLLVHQLKPPFLDGRLNFSTQQEMVRRWKFDGGLFRPFFFVFWGFKWWRWGAN
jgi:pre-mRNA-splicing factor ATP-dependent RNA helicase DHX38/PRP16